MSEFKIGTTDEVYRFVARLKAECRETGAEGLIVELDDALHLGSSGLEILGAIRQAIIRNRAAIDQLLDSRGRAEASEVVAFIDRAFGR